MAHSTRLCFLEIVSRCLTLASLFGRHHSAAQGGGSSWSGLQLHQRGGIPRPGGEWTAAGERHIRWYVSTRHSFTTLEAEKKKNRMENIMCWCELLAPRSPVFHLGLHIEWAAFVKRFSRLNDHPRCRTTPESAFGQSHTHSYTGGRDSLGVQFILPEVISTRTLQRQALKLTFWLVDVVSECQYWGLSSNVWFSSESETTLMHGSVKKSFWRLCQNSRWQQFKPLIAQIPPLF